jgi:hypothetical protein
LIIVLWLSIPWWLSLPSQHLQRFDIVGALWMRIEDTPMMSSQKCKHDLVASMISCRDVNVLVRSGLFLALIWKIARHPKFTLHSYELLQRCNVGLH